MSSIKILAIEDDPLYVESLEIVIEELGYELIAIVDNAEDALDALRREQPDVVLMDIQINGHLSGIELAKLMKPLTTAAVIYVTAFKDKHVIADATSTSPSAYIIKPYEPESLQAAIELAVFNRPQVSRKNASPPTASFYIKDNHRLVKVNIAEIVYVEVEEKYCYISTAQKRHVINMRLKDLLDRLPEGDFIQVHRSFVVRKSAIEEINNTSNEVILAGKKAFPVGKSFRETLLSSLTYLSKS